MKRNDYDKQLLRWVRDHYWDSLEKDKDLILRHLRTFAGDEDAVQADAKVCPINQEFFDVKEKMPPPHETVMALCTNGELYQARVCYGMHLPFWCGHSTLNFGVILRKKGLSVSHWAYITNMIEIGVL